MPPSALDALSKYILYTINRVLFSVEQFELICVCNYDMVTYSVTWQ